MCAERSANGGIGGSSLSRKNSRQLQARVFLLDDSVHTFSINSCAIGAELFLAIVEKQSVIESDYFDLEFVNNEGVRCWIDHSKSIVKQVGTGKDLVFIFAVKFYTPHPNLLEEEYTRYLFALQIKRDTVSGQLICSTNTAALLASYIAQAEIGDFLEEEYFDNSYLRQLKLVNQPNDEILNKIMEFHKTHIDMSPSEADFYLLDTARKIEYYGVKMHLAKDHENLPLNLSVTHMGVVVFQNLTKINTFSWAKIRKLSFKRKKFLIKLHPEGYGYYKGMVEFFFETRDDCKRFWKKCIEHHSFFRCPASDKSQRKKPRVVTKGSSFRYTGRTQKELIEYVRENYSSKRDNFQRPTRSKTVVKPINNSRNTRLVKSYHPFAIKSSHSAPSRTVSDSSDLNKSGANHTPRQKHQKHQNHQRSASGSARPRWSHSAHESPRKEAKEIRVITPPEPPAPLILPQPQKRSRKGRRFIQVSRTGSSADDDDDKRVTASEMSLSSSGRWEPKEAEQDAEEAPMPAREAFRGSDRLCRQRASIGGLGYQDSGTEGPQASPVPPQAPPQPQVDRIVCIDQYRSGRRPRPQDPLLKRFRSTPNSVAADTRLQAVDRLDGKELLADIPYVLLRRHKSPDQLPQRGHSRPMLSSKSLKSMKDAEEEASVSASVTAGPPFPPLRHAKSLDRRTAPRAQAGRVAIEALKSQLRAPSLRSVGGQSGPVFVSAHRLPPANNFSARDDTRAPRVRPGGGNRLRAPVSGNKESTTISDSEDSQLRETTDLESLLGMLPGNPVYLDSSSSSDDEGEFAISSDRCSRPRSVSESEFRLRTPRSSRRSSLCRGTGHTSSLSLTDSSFNSGGSFQSAEETGAGTGAAEEDGEVSGSPYSFLADCRPQPPKNLRGSSGDPVPVPGDCLPLPQTRPSHLEAAILPDDSPDEETSLDRGLAPGVSIFKQERISDQEDPPQARRRHPLTPSSPSSSDSAPPSGRGEVAPTDRTHLYEAIFDQAVVISPSPPPQDNLDMAIVLLNKAALSALSLSDCSNANKFQETVEGNLMSCESSNYASRAHSVHEDDPPEPDEYVLPDDRRSFSRSTSPSSPGSSESGEGRAGQHASSSSASEGSEEIEPFPPPPPQSDMLIFDERDEDIFQQMQQRTPLGGRTGARLRRSENARHPPLDFPPPAPILPVPNDDGITISLPVEEAIVPRFSRLLYGVSTDKETPHCSLVYDDDHDCDVVDLRERRALNCGFESLSEEEGPMQEHQEDEEDTMSIPRFYSFPGDDDEDEEYELTGSMGGTNRDPRPCPPGLRQLDCQSPPEDL